MLYKLEAGGERLMGKGDVITLRGWDLGGKEANAQEQRGETLPDAPATVTVPPEPSEIHSSLLLPLGQRCSKFTKHLLGPFTEQQATHASAQPAWLAAAPRRAAQREHAWQRHSAQCPFSSFHLWHGAASAPVAGTPVHPTSQTVADCSSSQDRLLCSDI